MTEPAAKAAPSANRAWLRALERTARLDKTPHRLLAHAVDDWAEIQPDAPALVSEDETLTYAALAARARAYVAWATAQGLAKGEVVALMAPNSPSYVAAWLGLTRLGVIVALINTNLRGAALAHCLAAAAPRVIIADPALADAIGQASPADAPRLWILDSALTPPLRSGGGGDGRQPGDGGGAPPFGPDGDGMGQGAVAARPLRHGFAAPPPPFDEGGEDRVTLSDPALLIYTSGTTGLPKAARVSHHRIMSWGGWFAGLMDAQPSDRLYDCLPMYHSVGGVAAVGAMLTAGGSVALREKFSASRFWDDVARFDCTIIQYIGELARYLLAAPPAPAERAHRLRLACGNGLSGDVWAAFKDRFNLPQILEFYAATEGVFSLYNVEGEPGAIGRIPGFMAHRFPAALVAFDPETGRPARGPDGLCRRVAQGQAGEAIGRISAGGDLAHRFEGYTAKADSAAKILRDVFEPGDAWLRTGDLMRQDARGFFYFVDRVGDTFRWKGENVATTQVAQVLAAAPGVAAACVFGVEIPGADGKAGMAALVPGDGFDVVALHAWLVERLPAYARPLLLRLVPDLAMTETFKQKKADLAREGYDPAAVTDPLFLLRPDGYEPLDALYAELLAARLRL